ncbi:hypothetical protein CR105_08310 [Massilia eurypsychrophila]|jgi:hypothetical protein|uniref:Tail specific protease domain-containing protein n=1 Tax=Massilia eurypsychrophila TaxID=1485217 RepID=A0A2G8TGK6_9BURK|nr:S41 family peptidase [Massilia eurypsychrophila]PIL45191.1 hypothetical protein CR105_08310 [Massilia eurypsychrophila]
MRLFAIGLLIFFCAASHATDSILITPDDVRGDLRAARAFIERTHPALELDLDAATGSISNDLSSNLTRDEAWSVMARLNPAFADAHVMIGYADWRGEARAHLRSGGGFFPFEVSIHSDGNVRILAWLGGQESLLAGSRIARINGRDAKVVVAELMERVHGDTLQFRARLLGQRFWFLLWKMYGAPASYTVELGSAAGMRLTQARSEAVVLQDDASFERQFQSRLLPPNAAVLVLGSFAWPDKERFVAFTREAFARIREERVNTLIIDVRLNGGGNDDYWIDGVLRYVAAKRFRWASTYVKRVLEGRAEPGQRTGDIVAGEVAGWVEPAVAEPLNFDGRVYVLTGDATYSSAILFANTVQDFGFGTVVGPGGAVRARQSGGTLRFVLPRTGLVVSSPRFVLDRPSGLRRPRLFTPDLVIADDLVKPDAMIDAVLAHSRRQPSP